MKMNNIFKWGIICLGCLCLVIVGVFIFNKNQNDGELVQIKNPLTEVKNQEEMKKYLGFDVPIINDKEVESYIVIGDDKYAEQGRIIYNDGSEFDMAKGKKDVSGIYGENLKQKEIINNNEVSIFTMENIIYATWNDSKYSYSYSVKNSNIEKLISDIKLIK